MPRYKEANYAQGQFVSIQFEHQLLPGSFEHALSSVVDHKINMTAFVALRKNDTVGAPANDPRVMLKIVLAAYARGMIFSREIAFACEQNVVFIALSARVAAGKQVLSAEMRAKEENAIKALEEKITTIDNWLNTEKDKISHTGLPKKSHL